MKPRMLAGAILTAIGIVALVAGSAIRFASHDEVPHDGAVKLTVTNEKVISIPPVLGGLAVAGGLLLMVLAARK